MKRVYRPCMVSTAVSLVLAATSSGNAYAQAVEATDTQAPLADVVVTGLRQSLQSSLEIKKNTLEVVDSVNAADIGKLPDPNVADSLARIPGVQLYRYAGEGSAPFGQGNGVSIRGLQGQTRSEYNGRSYFTAGQREYSLDAALPELVAGLDVFKNPTAEHIEGAIGGLVNVRTRHPFDFKGATAVLSAKENYYDFDEGTRPTFFGMVSNRFAVGDGELGALFAAGYGRSNFRSDAINIGAWTPSRLAPTTNPSYAGQPGVFDLVSGTGEGATSRPGDSMLTHNEHGGRTRYGFNGALQYTPRDAVEVYLEGDFNFYRYDQPYNFLQPNTGGRPVTNVVTAADDQHGSTLNPNNSLVSTLDLINATYLGLQTTALNSNGAITGMQSIGGRSWTDYHTGQVALGAKWDATDRLQISGDVQFIRAGLEKNERSATAAGRQGLAWDLTRNFAGNVPQVSIAGPSLSDPSNFFFNTLFMYRQEIDDTGTGVRLDGTYTFDTLVKDVKVGIRYADQKSELRTFSQNYALRGPGGASDLIYLSSLPELVRTSDTNYLRGDAGFSGGHTVVDWSSLMGGNISEAFPNAYRYYGSGLIATSQVAPNGDIQYSPYDTSESTEKTYAGYVMTEFEFELGLPFRGNAGVRVVKTDGEVSTFALPVGTNAASTDTLTFQNFVPVNAGSAYTDVLPSLNLTANVTEQLLARFSFSKGLTRPTLTSLNPRIAINETLLPTDSGHNAGNPDLRPQKAKSYDVSLEYYFSQTGYTYATVFRKDVEGFINTVASLETVPGRGDTQYLISRPVNGLSGKIDGAELGFQSFLSFLPGVFKNFGVQVNYTYIDATNEVDLDSSPTVQRIANVPLEYQSKNSYNAVGFYETPKFTARLAWGWRGQYARATNGGGNPTYPLTTPGYGTLDGSVSFNVNERLAFQFDAANLTNTAPDRYSGNLPRLLYTYDRRYGIGARYRFGE